MISGLFTRGYDYPGLNVIFFVIYFVVGSIMISFPEGNSCQFDLNLGEIHYNISAVRVTKNDC